MDPTRYSAEETTARGEAIYAERIRAKVEPAHHGKFLVVDIESGDYEIDTDHLTAAKRMLARHPEGILYGLRIGFPAAYKMGGRFAVSPA